jgi:MFS family permease
VSTYARVLRVPGMAPLLGAVLLARLPIGINALALVLFLRAEGGSFAVAGAAAGALALGAGIGAPIGARLVDRHGVRVLGFLAGGHATGLAGLLVLGSSGVPPAAILFTAALTGLTLPPASSVMRALYPRLLGGEPALVQGAFALDSVLTETIFIVGPLLTALLVALVAPGAALAVSGAAVVAGTLAFIAVLPREERGAAGSDEAPRDLLGALRSPGLRTLIGAMLPVGVALGALEVALPAFADHEGRRGLAGVLLAVWSLGSAAGGLAYGARPRRRPLARVHLTVALLLPAFLAPLVLAGSPLAMGLLLVPAGIFIAPLIATRNELAGVVAPAGSANEAYSWPLTALVAGVALGAASGGILIDAAGWRAAVVLAVCTSAAGAAVALARRRTLRGAAAVAA